MTYIVDPKIIYLISVLSSCRGVAVIMIFVLSVLACFTRFLIAEAKEAEEKELELKSGIALKKFIKGIVLCFLIIVVIPSKTTMREMVVAKIATTENIQRSGQLVNDFLTQIIEELKG